jgi:serine/threonine-protein kinase
VASLAGTTIDKYDMIEEVGCGGMAVVYRGRDRVLEREVAVKVLHPHLADRQESRLRLQREAIAVAKLRHENILEIFDYSGPDAAESYIVTEFIHGPTLKEWVDNELEPRPVIAAMIIHRLCLALTHAHKAAIVHRDIKPENVMVRKQDGVLKLMDFGIAQIIDNQKLTLTGQLIGSPAYMAPELISGKPLDARTDLFSLGILLYQLATGELPFSGRNPHEVLNRIADGEYPAPSTLCPLVDRDLEAIIAKTLAVNPDDRYQTVDTLARELDAYCVEAGIEPTPAELAGYFTDPPGYVIELDRRVCTHLMAKAEDAAANGSTARAIRMLGRVLELESEHKGANEMLKRLRVRERRVRQMLVVGGAMALAGLAAAGWMLVRPGPDGAKVAHDGLAAPVPAAIDAGTAGDDSPGDAAAVDPDDGASSEGGVPADVDTSTGAPAVAETGGSSEDEDSGGGTRIRRPPRANPKNGSTKCRIELDGVPLNAAQSMRAFRVGKKEHKVESSLTFDVVLEEESTPVSITDDDRYHFYKLVNASDCEGGKTVKIPVRPNPAQLSFSVTGGDKNTIVVCEKGCPKQMIGSNYGLDKFPGIPMGTDLDKTITLRFRHEDYYDATISEIVYPGPNPIRVSMKARQ